MGGREEIGGGRRPADHLLRPPRHLLAAAREGADPNGQQPLQRLANGGCLAGLSHCSRIVPSPSVAGGPFSLAGPPQMWSPPHPCFTGRRPARQKITQTRST